MATRSEWIAACQLWRDRLWLNQMELNHRDMERKERITENDSDADASTLAFVTTEPRYRRINIVHDPEVLEKLTSEKMKLSAAHEMTHAVLAPISAFVEGIMKRMSETERNALNAPWAEANEAVTSHIADVLTMGPDWEAHDHRLNSCKHTEGC